MKQLHKLFYAHFFLIKALIYRILPLHKCRAVAQRTTRKQAKLLLVITNGNMGNQHGDLCHR